MTPHRLKAPPSLEAKLLWYERARLVLVVVIALLVSTVLVYLVWNALEGKTTRSRLTSVSERVLSCTDTGVAEKDVAPEDWQHPPGDCYLANLKRTSTLVGDPPGGINTVVVAAAACARAVVDEGDTAVEAQAKTLVCTRALLERSASR